MVLVKSFKEGIDGFNLRYIFIFELFVVVGVGEFWLCLDYMFYSGV